MKPDFSRAYAPPDYTTARAKDGVFAIQAQAVSKANEGQQKTALDFIINEICRTYDLSYRPEEKGGERETAFAEGRRFVGLEIVKIIRSSFDALTKK